MLQIEFVLVALCVVHAVFAGNVLLGGMHASRSHLASMLPLGLRIAKDDHVVHFVESFSDEPSTYPANLTAHHFRTPTNAAHKLQLTSGGWRRSVSPDVLRELFSVGDDAFLNMQKHYPRKIAELLDAKWDLTIIDELFGMSMYGLAAYHYERNGTPYIIHSTSTMLHCFGWKLGLGRPLHHRPSMWFPHSDNLRYDVVKFRMRLRSTAHALATIFGIDFMTQHFSIKGIEQIGVKNFKFDKFWIEQAYNFHDDLEHFAFPAPVSNEVKHIGRFCQKPNALNDEFRVFMEDPRSQGTIFIALGTNVAWEYAPTYIINAFFDAFSALNEYRIIFAYNGQKPNRTIGAHVKLVPWCPQVDILNHNSTKLFITHGGMKSLREAICSGTPLIVLPLAAEQTLNGAGVLEMGIGQVLNKFTLTARKLESAMREVIGNDTYKRNSARFNRMYLDTPIPEMDQASFYANRTIRLGSRKSTFRIEGANLSWSTRLLVHEISLFALLTAVLSQ